VSETKKSSWRQGRWHCGTVISWTVRNGPYHIAKQRRSNHVDNLVALCPAPPRKTAMENMESQI
jgi:hypothetical protein